jgi:hypothetical protein
MTDQTLATAATLVADLAKSDQPWQYVAGQLAAYARVVAMLDGMRTPDAPATDLRDIALMLAAEAVTALAADAVREAT